MEILALIVLGISVIFSLILVPLFIWNRNQCNADYRHMDSKLEERYRESSAILRQIQDDIKYFHSRPNAIRELHSRLAALEGRIEE